MAGPAERFSCAGKVVLVTGATKGLGRAMSHGFAEAGADVIVSSRKADACEQLADELTATYGVRAVPAACHVGRWEDVDVLIERAYAECGVVDVLVNNAGVSPLYESLESVTAELFDKVIAVNLRGPFRLGSVIGTRMAAGTGGSIINVSSVGSIRPGWAELPYCLAKAGVNALTEGLAQAFAPNVRVNTLMPGPFATAMADAWTDEVRALLAGATELERVGEADEIVGAALFLASGASSYMTGGVVRVDGGLALSVPSTGDA